jgi:hypothetical protein
MFGVSEPGAYRVNLRGIVYFYVGHADLLSGVGRSGDARMVKHLAARDVASPLVSYSEIDRALLVPLGCELPGLLERAAVLCSGRAPQRRSGQRRYNNIRRDVAESIWVRLTS